jgi:hypothetical protein
LEEGLKGRGKEKILRRLKYSLSPSCFISPLPIYEDIIMKPTKHCLKGRKEEEENRNIIDEPV